MDTDAFIAVQQFHERLQDELSVETLLFFGSRTTSTYSEDSDIDLIVVSPAFHNMRFSKRVALLYDYWDGDYPVDFLCYTPEEFEERKDRAFTRQVLEEGVIVADTA